LTNGDCLYAPGKLEGGLAVKFLLDTGASGNVLSRNTFNQLPRRKRDKLITEEITASMADGSGLLIYGHVQLSCRIRSTPVSIHFSVANIAEDAILGMSFFMENKCQLLLDQGLLKIQGKELACIDQSGYPLSSKIQVIHKIQIPAETEMQISCRLTCPTARCTGLVENHHEDIGIRIASAVADTNSKLKLVVHCINPHSSPVELKNGATIGTFTVVSDNQISNEATDSSPKATSQPPPTVNPPLPGHVQCLYDQAVHNCSSSEQEQQLLTLLSDYADVFSAHDTDVGRTDLITHSIPTLPGTQPIKPQDV
jgi:hypothetical protein